MSRLIIASAVALSLAAGGPAYAQTIQSAVYPTAGAPLTTLDPARQGTPSRIATTGTPGAPLTTLDPAKQGTPVRDVTSGEYPTAGAPLSTPTQVTK